MLRSLRSTPQATFPLKEICKLESLLNRLLAPNLLGENPGREPGLKQAVLLLRQNPRDLLLHKPLQASVLPG
jgi:hypothetical protein